MPIKTLPAQRGEINDFVKFGKLKKISYRQLIKTSLKGISSIVFNWQSQSL
jgi:hypothetical protein